MAGSKAATRWRTCPSSGHRLRFELTAFMVGPICTAPTTPTDNPCRTPIGTRPWPSTQWRDPNSGLCRASQWTTTVRKRARGDSWDFGLVVLGVFAMIGGLSLIHIPTLPTHQFVPSPPELDVLRTGGTGTPPDCSGQVANSVSNQGYGAEINPREANTEITVYPDSLVLIDGNSPEISANAPLCNLASSSSVSSASAEVTYVAERPGVATIYFIDSDAHVSVAKILVTASTPPSSLPGWAVLVVGALATACGAVLMIRWKAWRSDR